MSQQRSCLRGTGKRSAHSHPKCSGGLHLWPPCVLEGNMAWIIPQQLPGSSIPQHKRLCTGKVAFWWAGIRLAGTTAPLPATGVGLAPCAGVGGLHQWGVQAHLWGFISYWVHLLLSFGDPQTAPSHLPGWEREAGKLAGSTAGQGCRTGAFSLFPGAAGVCRRWGEPYTSPAQQAASVVLAPGPCSLPPSSSVWGASKGGRKTIFLPPLVSVELCSCRIPAGHLLGKFSLFLGELSLASCSGGSSHPPV